MMSSLMSLFSLMAVQSASAAGSEGGITWFQALISAIVEGITEFLPISSTGHLLVCSQIMHITNTAGTFEVVIQLGAVIAVVLFYWKKLMRRAKRCRHSGRARLFWFNLLVAFMPAAVFGLLLDDAIDSLLSAESIQLYVIAASLIVGGIILWIVDKPGLGEETDGQAQVQEPGMELLCADTTPGGASCEMESYECDPAGSGPEGAEGEADKYRPVKASRRQDVTTRQALLIGIAQCFAMIPGVSRSASTIVGGLLVGLSRKKATEFSFFLSIPTLGAATLYKLYKDFDILMQASSVGIMIFATVVTFFTSLLAIGWLLRYISSHDFRGFAVYRVLAGIFIIVWAMSR